MQAPLEMRAQAQVRPQLGSGRSIFDPGPTPFSVRLGGLPVFAELVVYR